MQRSTVIAAGPSVEKLLGLGIQMQPPKGHLVPPNRIDRSSGPPVAIHPNGGLPASIRTPDPTPSAV